jgi:hypothetical protein
VCCRVLQSTHSTGSEVYPRPVRKRQPLISHSVPTSRRNLMSLSSDFRGIKCAHDKANSEPTHIPAPAHLFHVHLTGTSRIGGRDAIYHLLSAKHDAQKTQPSIKTNQTTPIDYTEETRTARPHRNDAHRKRHIDTKTNRSRAKIF